jgi:hypothetical protein
MHPRALDQVQVVIANVIVKSLKIAEQVRVVLKGAPETKFK